MGTSRSVPAPHFFSAACSGDHRRANKIDRSPVGRWRSSQFFRATDEPIESVYGELSENRDQVKCQLWPGLEAIGTEVFTT